MKRPRRRFFGLIAGLVVGPPVLWGTLLATVPTEWARTRIVAALRLASHQDVRLDRVRFRALGGVRLEGLELTY